MKMKVPFASETLQPKLNALGEPVKRDFLGIGTDKPSEINKLPIGFPSKKIGDTKLNSEKYNLMLQERGKLMKPLLDKINTNPEWWIRLTQEEKENVVDKIEAKVNAVARGKTKIQMDMEARGAFGSYKKMEALKKNPFVKKYGGK